MLKSVSKIFLILALYVVHCAFCIAQAQTGKATFIEPIKVDESRYIVWSGYVIDSTYWHVWNPDGTLPKRENGTYKYWKADNNGNLIPLRKIDYRLPIFQGQSVVMKKEESLFNNEAIEQ